MAKDRILTICQREKYEKETALEDRRNVISLQSDSLELLKNQLDILFPDDSRRTRVRRNLDGSIMSANLCQCKYTNKIELDLNLNLKLI